MTKSYFRNLLFFIITCNFLAACNLFQTDSQQEENQGKKEEKTITYQNPILDRYLADPFIFSEGGEYYLIGSHKSDDGKYMPIYHSKDLDNWQFVTGAVENGAENDWNYKHFWAPEIIKIGDTYYLYYTASTKYSPENINNRVGVATAKNITGPYVDKGVVIQHGSIDGHPFIDKDGQMYMYFTAETKNSKGLPRGRIYVYKMSDPYTVEGEPIELIGWNGWQEGAFIIVKNNEYWMTYSRNGWNSERYEVMLAKSPHPTGPFLPIETPLLNSSKLVKGPGHNSIFFDNNHNPWLVYHGWDPEFKARYPRIDPLIWQDNGFKKILPTMTRQLIQR